MTLSNPSERSGRRKWRSIEDIKLYFLQSLPVIYSSSTSMFTISPELCIISIILGCLVQS